MEKKAPKTVNKNDAHKTIEIRKIVQTDRRNIAKVASGTPLFTPEEVHCVLDLWDDTQNYPSQPNPYLFLGAYAGKRLIGFSCYGHRSLTKGAYDLYWIAVDVAQQHHGVGKKLLKATETSVKRHKGNLLLVETSDRPDYAPTRQFYADNGYIECGRVPNFYNPDDGLVMYYKELRKKTSAA